MLPKKNRADKRVIEKVFKYGRSINTTSLNLKFFKEDKSSIPKLSFIVPKNVAKLAVTRNSLRRKGYLALKKFINQAPRNIVGVFIYKKLQKDVLIIENEIKEILSKIS